MLFSFYNLDRADPGKRRQELMAEHRAYLSNFSRQIAFAGPLVAQYGETIIGSLLVLEFPSLREARHFIEAEPYTQAGLYASVNISEFRNRWEQKAGFPPSKLTVLDGLFSGNNPAV